MDILKVSKVKPFDQTTQPGPASPQPAPAEPDAADDKMDAGMDALLALAEKQLAERFREQGFAGLNSVTPMPTPEAAPVPTVPMPAPMASNCKPAASVPALTSWFSRNAPRNAPCRCGSGAKYKRCCGKNAAPVLGRAA
jgi:SEC-C motif